VLLPEQMKPSPADKAEWYSSHNSPQAVSQQVQ